MLVLPRLPEDKNSRSYAFRVLLDNIISIELAPGQAVSENELSSAMSLSRTPVREALIELSKMGMVTIQPQRGTYISKIDYRLIDDNTFIRENLEVAVIRLLAEQGIRDPWLTQLQKNVEAQLAIINIPEAASEQLQLDDRFHRLLFDAAGKSFAFHVIYPQFAHMSRLRTLKFRVLDSEDTIKDHEKLLYAVTQQDAGLAEFLMRRHLNRYREEEHILLKKYPDYFTERR